MFKNLIINPCVLGITQPERETNYRTTFVFSFSIINVSDKFHRFHHLECHQFFFYIKIPCQHVSTWVLKVKTINIIFMLKSQV